MKNENYSDFIKIFNKDVVTARATKKSLNIIGDGF